MNQDSINTATKEIIDYFQEYLEGKNRVLEYREFKKDSFKAPIEIKNYLSNQLIATLSAEELEVIKLIDLFGILHIDATNTFNTQDLTKQIQLRKLTNKAFQDMLKNYIESQNNDLWFLNQIAKIKLTYKKILNNESSHELSNVKAHLDSLFKEFNIDAQDHAKLITQLIVELEIFGKYLIYATNVVKFSRNIDLALALIEKLSKQNLLEDYKNSWILARALSENPQLLETFSDEIFLTSRIPLAEEETTKIKADLANLGITLNNSKIELSTQLISNYTQDFNKIVAVFSSNANNASEFLKIFNSLEPNVIENIGNLFELLRFYKNRADCNFLNNNRLVNYSKQELEDGLNIESLATVFDPNTFRTTDKYLIIIQAFSKLKKENSKLNKYVDGIVLCINSLVQNYIEIFDNLHTENSIDSLFSFFYQFKYFNLYSLAFYNDLPEIFNVFNSQGLETIKFRFENFFHNYISILNLVTDNPERYAKLVEEHNKRLLSYVNKEILLLEKESDYMAIIINILAWADEENGLIDVPLELFDRIKDIKNNKTEVLTILKDLHVKLLNAYSQLFFEFLNKGLKTANTEEVAKQYNPSIVDRLTNYSKILAYFYVIGFYFELEPNLTFKHKFSAEAFDQYIRGY